MSKAIRILLLVSMLFTMSFVAVNAAGPTGTYGSGITCVNLDNVAGTFVITFYKADGSQVSGQINDSIGAQGVKLYFTPNIAALPASFLGSAVVSSDVQLACAVNTQTTSGILRVGTSNGVPSTRTGSPLYVPQILNNLGGFSSYVAVQNTTNAAASVTATYYDRDGVQKAQFSQNIPANSSNVFYQDDGKLPAGFLGSAKFESSAALAGTAAIYNDGASAGTAQLLSYNAFTSGATKIFGPRVVKNLSNQGFTSGVTCQNVGTSNVDITMNITMADQGAGNAVKNFQMIKANVAPGVSWAPYMGTAGLNATLDGINAGLGGAVINATGPVACIFNEDNRTIFAGWGSTYSGIPAGEESTTMFFPQVVSLGASSYQGGFQFLNTTNTATTCTYTFSNGDVVSGQALAANESKSVYAPNVLTTNPNSFNGSVIVTCGQPIVGIYNLGSRSVAGDSFATNNGINR